MSTTVSVGMVPKSTRNLYFEDCHKGALEAAAELGFELRWDGPEEPDASRQAEIVRAWTREGIPAIAVSVEDGQALSPALRDARARKVKVVTWDADADADARDFAVVQATPEGVAQALAFEVGRMLGGKGALAVITSSLTAPNQVAWLAQFRDRVARDYPLMTIAVVRPCNDVADIAREEAQQILQGLPELGAIVGLCAPAVPAAAEAVKQAGRAVRVTGISVPAACRAYIENGMIASVVTWKTRNLGYLAAAAAHGLVGGTLQPGASVFKAGRLGSMVIKDDEIRLGRLHVVSQGNLSAFLS